MARCFRSLDRGPTDWGPLTIALGTGPSQIFRIVVVSMLRSDDVVDVERRGIAGLRKRTVLATIAGAGDDRCMSRGVDQLRRRGMGIQRKPRSGMPERQQIGGGDVSVILLCLLRRERTLIAFHRQFPHADLIGVSEANFQHRLCQRRERPADRESINRRRTARAVSANMLLSYSPARRVPSTITTARPPGGSSSSHVRMV